MTHEAQKSAAPRSRGPDDIADFDYGDLGAMQNCDRELIDVSSPEAMLQSMGMEELIFVSDDYVEGESVEAESKEQDDYKPSIQEGDFENPAQRFLFRCLREQIRDACNVGVANDARMKALNWIFVPGTEEKHKIDFDSACIALSARPIVVRARVMHKLWESAIVPPEPLPFLAVLPPNSIINEIDLMLGGKHHATVARLIWGHPGVHAEVLRSMFMDIPAGEYAVTINDLEAHGYIGVNAARLYFISRNAALISPAKRARWQFSTSILGDY